MSLSTFAAPRLASPAGAGRERKPSHVANVLVEELKGGVGGMIGVMSQPRVPAWFPATIVAFVALLLLVAYAADPPMAYLIAGLMAAYFLVSRIVDLRVDRRSSEQTREKEARP